MNEKDWGARSVQRVVLTVLSVVLGILLVGMIGAVVCSGHLLDYDDVSYQAAPIGAAEGITALENEADPVLQGFTVPELTPVDMDFGTGPQLQVGGGDIVNILLVGQDVANKAGTRSDTMILCTFNKTQNTITLTSFLRDLYVEIPGHRSDRINAAYALGGIQLLNETLYENFGVTVDGNVQVDFEHFREIIDLLGGVTLELTDAEAAFIKKHVPGSAVSAGSNLLSGKEALMYARNRKDVDGDFSRTNRQRKLLNALIEKYKSKRLTEMLGLLNDLRSLITTDISKSDLTAYAVKLLPMLDDAQICTQSIPVSDGYHHAKIDGKAVLVPDMEKNRQALEDALT